MTQATNFGVERTGPRSPTDMYKDIDENFDAALDHHSGSARPPYAVKDMIWADTSVSGVTTYKYFDGADDRVLYSVTSSGEISMPAIEDKMIVKAVHTFQSSTSYSRTSQTEGSLSDVFDFYPQSSNSRFQIHVVARVMVRATAGSEDARADMRVAYYDSSQAAYMSLKTGNLGVVNVQNTAAGLGNYHYANVPFLIDQSQIIVAYGSTPNRIRLRLRGECGFAGNELFVYQFDVTVTEYENV